MASKFAMVKALNRPYEKKFLDAADFISMVEFNAAAIRPTRLQRFGDTINSGGGEELLRQMDNVKAGRRLEF